MGGKRGDEGEWGRGRGSGWKKVEGERGERRRKGRRKGNGEEGVEIGGRRWVEKGKEGGERGRRGGGLKEEGEEEVEGREGRKVRGKNSSHPCFPATYRQAIISMVKPSQNTVHFICCFN